MSMSRQAGIVLPGYNPLLVANAPTIGTATQATATSVSVAFTAPSCTGGSVISTYSAYCTTTGTNRVTGASSPIVVTGLTTGQAYTFRVIATNIYGPSYPSGASNSVTPSVVGQDAYITAGTYSWVAPAGVTSVSAVVVSGGADGTAGNFSGCIPKGGFGGGGGGLAYVNNLSVTPGSSYSVVVGASSGISSFNSTAVRASGASGRTGGAFLNGTAGFSGGTGGNRSCYTGGGGGGGAAGYSGAGGAGGTNGAGSAAGTGGGAGGGGARTSSGNSGGGGGGVGILGQGGNGAAGNNVGTTGGGGGSCGATGGTGANASNGAAGGLYGGGGGGAGQIGNCTYSGGAGRSGAVRIIYPGTTRSFPSTNTGNL